MTPEAAFDLLMKFEGGDKLVTDSGGLTKWGISQKAYPALDIARLSKEDAYALFLKDYWNRSHAAELPEELQYIHLDTAYNCGVETAIKIMQAAAGCASVDGIFGQETKLKIASVKPEGYLLYRLGHYIDIVTQNPDLLKYLKGWYGRVKAIGAMSKTVRERS